MEVDRVVTHHSPSEASREAATTVDGFGRTPLMLLLKQRSSRRGFRRRVSALSLQSWAHKDSFGKTSLHYFAANAKGVTNTRVVCEALKLELERGHTHTLESDIDGNNALHCVARQNVATSSSLSPFEETAATVVTRFLVESFLELCRVLTTKVNAL